ncbi:aminotransferase class I/II-fold pyridoxal phosphate-dependent enzyme [Holzapfeliella sp. JNUCC 80]
MSSLINRLNKNLSILKPNSILEFNAEISQIEDIVHLTIGEPDFNTPDHVKQAAIKSIENNESHYTNPRGTIELRTAASQFLKSKYGLNYNPEDQLIITAGVTEAIYATLSTILNPGDKVILPTPIFPLYIPIMEFLGASPIYIDTSKTDFKLSKEQLKKALDEDGESVKAVVLNFPNNPTGVTYNQAELEDLASVIANYDIFCISDEIYSELSYQHDHVSMGTILPEQTLVFNGVSKSHAMTGWRIGVIGGPAPIINEVNKVHQFLITSATTNAQAAATEAFKNGLEDGPQMREAYAKRVAILEEGLSQLGFDYVKPNGAFYLFAKIPEQFTQDSFEFSRQLAHGAKVAVIPGSCFGPGGEGYVRISFAASEKNIKTALDRIKTFLNQVK